MRIQVTAPASISDGRGLRLSHGHIGEVDDELGEQWIAAGHVVNLDATETAEDPAADDESGDAEPDEAPAEDPPGKEEETVVAPSTQEDETPRLVSESPAEPSTQEDEPARLADVGPREPSKAVRAPKKRAVTRGGAS